MVSVARVPAARLYATCARGSHAGRAVAGLVTGLLGGFALLGILTIGVFVLPCAALLCGAVVTTPRGGS